MGFKRTPEGRIFFQGEDETPESKVQNTSPAAAPVTANDAPPRPQQASLLRAEKMQSPQTGPSQGQIITLLKTLNERLKITQNERDKMMSELQSYRTVIEDLEDKAERNERMTLDLENKLHQESAGAAQKELTQDTLEELTETRRLLVAIDQKHNNQSKALDEKISKSTVNYAALARRLKDTESKQSQISEKVEGAITQQAKLMRKVDKAIEDRARFMRKIERIEETVIQTRDSLNAKAMVVLADQTIAGDNAQALHADDFALTGNAPQADHFTGSYDDSQTQAQIATQAYRQKYAKAESEAAQHWLKRPATRQAATILGLIVVCGILGGVALNAITDARKQNAASYTLGENRFEDSEWQIVDLENFDAARNAVSTSLPQVSEPQAIESMEWEVEETPPSILAQATQGQASQEQASDNAIGQADDIGAVDLKDQQQVEAAITGNVAKELNQIEPQRITASDRQAEAAPSASTLTEVAAPATKPAISQTQLMSMINADGSLPNVVKAIEDQAFTGSAEAQHDLAAIYTAGHGGVAQNYERALFWFERAAENGIANASYNLAVLHHQGLGTQADINSAMEWYTQAANQGHPEAQYNLGIAYIEGIGVKYDPTIAAQYFERAADNGIMEAAYNLGLIYENGLLGNAKPEDALMWYKAAADQGSPEAKQALQELARSLQIDLDEVNRVADSMRAAKQASNSGVSSSVIKTSTAANSIVSDQAIIAQIQEYLMGAGLYPGPADGMSGALTQDAIRSYQSLNSLNKTGEPSADLLSHMLQNAQLGSRAN